MKTRCQYNRARQQWRAQIKGWFLWHTLGNDQGTGDSDYWVTSYFDTKEKAREAILNEIDRLHTEKCKRKSDKWITV